MIYSTTIKARIDVIYKTVKSNLLTRNLKLHYPFLESSRIHAIRTAGITLPMLPQQIEFVH